MNAAKEPGHEAGIEATREDALVEALVVMCVAYLKEHGRLEKKAVLSAFNDATGASIASVPPGAQARVFAEVRRRLEATEGVDIVALEGVFLTAPEGMFSTQEPDFASTIADLIRTLPEEVAPQRLVEIARDMTSRFGVVDAGSLPSYEHTLDKVDVIYELLKWRRTWTTRRTSA